MGPPKDKEWNAWEPLANLSRDKAEDALESCKMEYSNDGPREDETFTIRRR